MDRITVKYAVGARGVCAIAMLLACGSPAPSPAPPAPSTPAAPSDAPLGARDAALAADADTPDAAASAGPASAAEVVTLRLAAWCAPGSAEPTALDVALAVSLDTNPVFRLDDVVHGTPGMAALIEDARASDGRGELPLARTVANGALVLAPQRASEGQVTLRYRARGVAAGDRGARHGLRHDGANIGGHGDHFVVLPGSRRSHRLRVEWGASTCAGPAVVGSSSFTEHTGTIEMLRMAAYFAGRPRRHAIDDGALHLRLAIFGTTSIDVEAATRTTARVLAAQRAFFDDRDPAPYQVFIQVLPGMGDRANGMGMPSSLISAIGPATVLAPRLAINLAHEMLHRWVGLRLRLAGPDGTAFWFTEGFTVYYTTRILLQTGVLSPAQLGDELDGITTRHFANPRIGASNAEIQRDFYADDALSVLPYTRGALYAAELDGAIRKASRGARSLDDLIRALYQDALVAPVGAAGLRELPPAAVRDAIARELGTAGVARYDAVIVRGEPPEPPGDAFGSCFTRVERTYPVFDLGFDERRSSSDRVIRGLVPGSPAAKAGLREGQAFQSIAARPLFPDKEAVVTIDGSTAVRFLPARATGARKAFAYARTTATTCTDR